MKPASPLQEQLRSLSIPREQRPEPSAVGRPQTTRRWLVRLGGAVVAAGALYAGYDRFFGANSPGGSTAAEIRLVRVTTRSVSEPAPVLTATGKIVSDHRVQVSTKVSGQVIALFFEQGDRVERGQVLARIEDVIYKARRDEAAALLARARAEVEFQKVNFARVERLMAQQQASEIEYAETRRDLETALAQVAAGEAVLTAAEKALADCEVTAPIGGVVLERNVEVGDFVAAEGGRGAMANAQFAVIADMSKLRVEVDVSELDISRLTTAMPCFIIPDADKTRRYSGRLLWIDPGANYAKATVQVKVRIVDPDDALRVEGAAQVLFLAPQEVTAAEDSPRMWIPVAACRAEPAGNTGQVLVNHGGRLRATLVTLGRRQGGEVEVVSGLTEGQELAADFAKARDGQRVGR